MVKPIALVQDYLDQFKCIGAACSDNCCKGWDVDIDRHTYQLYQSLEKSPLADQFKTDLVINTKPHPDGVDYAQMVLTAKKHCPFLTQDDWCSIQRHHGEKALSLVCHNFPRTFNNIDDVIEVSATLSCPEVARLVLVRESVLELRRELLERSKWVINQTVHQSSISLVGHPAKYLSMLRGFFIEVMGDQQLSFYRKLVKLGMFHEGLMPYHVKDTVDHIPRYIETFKKEWQKKNMQLEAKGYKPSADNQIRFYSKFYQLLPKGGQLGDEFFDTMNLTAFQLTSFSRTRKLKEVKQDLLHLQKTHLNPFLKKHPFFLINYCLHFNFKYLYPFSEEGDPYTAFTMLLCRLYLIQLYCLALAKENGELTMEIAVTVVQKLTKVLEHNREFFKELANYMMSTGLDHLSEILTLIVDESGYE
jgi:lysine-N-methylase